ncbi:MAG TPA: translation elongation factor Ts [Burkholderiales bacterium]|jgi:elongation factor Ts|nr:translation elongation factor Ts [Burkholderiales bacterium]
MAEISAGLVKELREMTGLGMMECKKALAEAGGDLKKAEELLRIKSGAKAGKAAGRVAAEGIIGAYLSADAKLGALVELNCETDFVAKNDDFVAFAQELARLVAEKDPADFSEVEGKRQSLVQKIGENITIRRSARIQTQAKLAQYVHNGKIGVLVDYDGDDAAGRDVAMHVSFAKPAFMTRAEVPAEVVERERGILAARAKESGKPEAIVAKMVEGGLNKFLGEQTLLGQPFIKDDKQTIEKMLAAKKTRLLGYRFLVVGEGIEKKATDFAAEVKSMVKN